MMMRCLIFCAGVAGVSAFVTPFAARRTSTTTTTTTSSTFRHHHHHRRHDRHRQLTEMALWGDGKKLALVTYTAVVVSAFDCCPVRYSNMLLLYISFVDQCFLGAAATTYKHKDEEMGVFDVLRHVECFRMCMYVLFLFHSCCCVHQVLPAVCAT